MEIRKTNVQLDDELSRMEEYFINDAYTNFERHIEEYISLEPSINGQYVCSDLFKETFNEYSYSKETRGRYNTIVHNSASALAGLYFERLAKDPKIKKCVIITGVPGAGKTFFIQSLALSNQFGSDTMIFEGDVTGNHMIDKINLLKENGKELLLIVINPTLELAQRNVIERFYTIGRGATPELMARIISRIPEGVKRLHDMFDIELGIFNKTSNHDVTYSIGIEHIDELNHGTEEQVLEELLMYRDEILSELRGNNERRK